MTVKYRTKAFIMEKEGRSESDGIFKVFTEEFGKINLHAKAIRKINSKLRAGIDLFYLSEVEFIEGKNHKTLTDASLINKNDKLLYNNKKTEFALKIIDILDNFIKGESKDEKSFYLFCDAIEKIISSEKYEDVYQYFLWNFLARQGYGPETSKCTICEEKLNPYNIFFSYKEGGSLCRSCAISDFKAQKINSDVLKILRIILAEDWETFSKLKITSQSRDMFKNISDNAVKNFCPA